MGGVIASTVLTLLLIPTFYDILASAGERVLGRLRPAHRSRQHVTLALVVLSWLGCASRPDAEAHVVVPPSAGAASSYAVPGVALRPAPGDCPMSVEGAEVLFVPLEYGGALVFTSSQASPAVLRRAVRRFASACEGGAAQPLPAGMPASVRYADTIAGGRVEIRALAASQVPRLERHLRWLASDMREHRSCDAAAARVGAR